MCYCCSVDLYSLVLFFTTYNEGGKALSPWSVIGEIFFLWSGIWIYFPWDSGIDPELWTGIGKLFFLWTGIWIYFPWDSGIYVLFSLWKLSKQGSNVFTPKDSVLYLLCINNAVNQAYATICIRRRNKYPLIRYFFCEMRFIFSGIRDLPNIFSVIRDFNLFSLGLRDGTPPFPPSTKGLRSVVWECICEGSELYRHWNFTCI